MNPHSGNAEDILCTIDEVGYCVVPEVIDCSAANEARLALAKLEGLGQSSETVRSTRNVMTKHKAFRRLMCHTFVIDLWRRYLGEDMICSSCTGVTLLPGYTGMVWHVDYPYWTLRPPYPTWNLAAYALWMLDDFTEDNGTTGIIPCSHRRDHPPDIDTGEWPGDAVIATGAKGERLVGPRGVLAYCPAQHQCDPAVCRGHRLLARVLRSPHRHATATRKTRRAHAG